MLKEILSKFHSKYGPSSMERIQGMLSETRRDRERRHPLQARAPYVLPGLSNAMVIPLRKYPDLQRARDRFMQKHTEIRGEILQHLARKGRPDVHGGYDKPGGEQWRVVFLNRVGRNVDSVAPFFPQTMSYIQECGDILFPVAGINFSLLEPSGYIAPHSDRSNVFIHFHQAVITPAGCGLKVGDNEIIFEERESYLFDPSFVHEAWNRSPHNRIHLILPVWHPDTTLPEREALTEVFQSLREFAGR